MQANSSRNINVVIDERINNVESLTVVGAVSREFGFDCYLIKPKSINGESFIQLLEILIERN